MQTIFDNTVNIISMSNNGLLVHSTCLYPFYSPDNTMVGFWVQDYDYTNDIYLSTYHLYIKDLYTNSLTKVDIGNGSNPLIENTSSNRFIYGAHFSPDSYQILFLTTSTNLIFSDTDLYSKPVSNDHRWYYYDIFRNTYNRVMYNGASYGNLPDYHEALWIDNRNIAVVSYSNNLNDNGTLYAIPSHLEVFSSNLDSNEIFCLSADPINDIFFTTSSMNISVSADRVSFYNISLGYCIKELSTEILTRVQDLPGISSLGIVTADVFSWDSTGDKFLFRIATGNSILTDTNNAVDDFVYKLSTDTIYAINESTYGFVYGSGYSTNALFSPSGNSVAFLSNSNNIDPSGTNNVVNLYVKDLFTGILTKVSGVNSTDATDVLGYNWLTENILVYTSYSQDLQYENNNNLDWFTRDINDSYSKRINYGKYNDSLSTYELMFSINNESVKNIRRETFNIDGNTILFSAILNSFDNTSFITPSYDMYNIFSKVFKNKEVQYPDSELLKPNDSIKSTIKNPTTADIARIDDIYHNSEGEGFPPDYLTSPEFSIIGSNYVERVNSIRYRNDISSDIKWMSIKYPNLPYDAPSSIKIGAGIFKATPTLLDDVYDIKMNNATTTINPVIGILTTYTVRPQNDIVLVTAGTDQQRVCEPMIFLEATVQGNSTFGHTAQWELISGDPIDIIVLSFTTAYYDTDGSDRDRVFRYWIDKDKFNQQYQDITVYATPTSIYKSPPKVSADINLPNYSELTIDTYSPFTNFDFTIPFNSKGGDSYSLDINWDLPKIYKLNDETANHYKSLFKSSGVEVHNGSNWQSIGPEALFNEVREAVELSSYDLIRFSSTYYNFGQDTTVTYYSLPEYILPSLLANTVFSPILPSSSSNTDYTLMPIIYDVNNNNYEDTLSNISMLPSVNGADVTIIPLIYDVTGYVADDTLYNTYTASATNSFTLTLFNGDIIGG